MFRHVDVSENSGTPKSSILIGFSMINHPFWSTPIFGNTHVQFSVSHVHTHPNVSTKSSAKFMVLNLREPGSGTIPKEQI